MKTYLKTGLTLVGKGLLELMHVIFILSIGVITYYLVRNLPIDDMLAIALSIGAGLVAAYGVYGANNVVTLASIETSDTHQYQFDNESDLMDSIHSDEIENIYFKAR